MNETKLFPVDVHDDFWWDQEAFFKEMSEEVNGS